jgi:hypothetical protein
MAFEIIIKPIVLLDLDENSQALQRDFINHLKLP